MHPDGQPPQQREALARVALRQTRSSGHHAPCSQRPPRDERRRKIFRRFQTPFHFQPQTKKICANIRRSISMKSASSKQWEAVRFDQFQTQVQMCVFRFTTGLALAQV